MSLIDRFFPKRRRKSYLKDIISGTLYKISDMRSYTNSYADIQTQIDTMRALARDSQVATTLSLYATDATLTNSAGQIIWATAVDKSGEDAAEIINTCFKRWRINSYVRDHILELATIGNLYIPTKQLFNLPSDYSRKQIGLDTNSIKDKDFDIVPSYKLPPENVLHIWYQGEPVGYIYQPDDDLTKSSQIMLYPEESIIHFSLGGLLGNYTLDTIDKDNNDIQYDIQFAQPLLERATQPTQVLSLLEDSVLLSSLIRVIKFINVDVGGGSHDEEEIRDSLQQIKDAVEQQLSLNTLTGDAQSFVNPQSPNNLIYVPKVNGQDPISVTDLNMSEATAEDSKLLDYFQNKKLSVLGIPKEALNFSSNEGLGGAGSVLSQRSSLYANSLQRIETAYIDGWTDAFNKYFTARGYSGFIDKFQLHMQPIITEQSTASFEKRDAAISQAAQIVDLMKALGVDNADKYREVLTEILSEALPTSSTDISKWGIHPKEEGGAEDEF